MTDDQPQRFRVIQGGEKPKPYRKRHRKDAELLTCSTCERDIGVSTTATFEGKLGTMVRGGRAEGGTKALFCLRCLSRGKLTQLL